MTLVLPETFRYERQGRIAVMTIDRPEKMNALTTDMLVAMDAAFEDFNEDPELLVAILTGAGQKSFCAGMDLEEALPAVIGGNQAGYEDPVKRPFAQVFKPIIAAINGFCIAGGMEFLEGTDLRIAAEHAVFGLSEVCWGVVPSGGSHIRLPRQIPWAIAMELILTGENIDARRACEVGLVNRVVAGDQLMSEVMALAERICQNGPLAVRTAKEIAVRGMGLETGYLLEKTFFERVRLSEDVKEGARAFAERRNPRFGGR
ncbi:MAG: enoyl-CoA hydratase/isomerase family protein [bacterium]|nr:enoyl-CoA hydratase [Deltaproteobacteria bacterium]MCP4907114.1 enoyl-CoA hydratase/isomerase family protein [bacterium]